MRRYYGVLILVVVAAFAVAFAQAPAKPPAAKPPAARTSGAASLPSRATVDSFLKHMFGYDPSISWTVTAIKPSPATGISEIDLDIKTTQKSGQQKMFVLPGNKRAVLGEMVPFPGEAGPRPSDTAINTFVRQMTGSNPAITWAIGEIKPNAVANLTEVTVVLTTPQGRGAVPFMVAADGKYALRGDLAPFSADPFAVDRAKLAKGVNGPSRGPAGAPLIVEFADLQCPACKAANAVIQKLVSDEPKARFVFQQFPLTQIHKWAFKAAEFGDCLNRENPAAFWRFVDGVYAVQEKITSDTGNTDDAGKKAEAKLTELASGAGANGKQAAFCANDPATPERVNRSVALGKAVEVTGTPTLFVNGRRIGNLGQLPYDQLKRLVDFMLAQK
jgi:protein-disulfide isomerase